MSMSRAPLSSPAGNVRRSLMQINVAPALSSTLAPVITGEAAMPRHKFFAEAVAQIDAPVSAVFEFLDDQANLSAHMSDQSWMMLGTRMDLYTDDQASHIVGSRFGFTGRILGIPLRVDEIVTSREPPRRKTWETTREPTLWVIGRYQMGFELTPSGRGTRLHVHLCYDPPANWLLRPLCALFGSAYARWCTSRMVDDAQLHFAAFADRAVLGL